MTINLEEGFYKEHTFFHFFLTNLCLEYLKIFVKGEFFRRYIPFFRGSNEDTGTFAIVHGYFPWGKNNDIIDNRNKYIFILF